jgi:hypothetical protein
MKLFVKSKREHYSFCFDSESKYIIGYFESSKLLLEELTIKDDDVQREKTLFPAIFMFRHYLELHLKRLFHLSNQLCNNNKEMKNHSILQYLNALLTNIESSLGEEYIFDIGIKSLINQIHEIDNLSQRFRYATDKKGMAYHDDVQNCEISVLRNGMIQIYEYLWVVDAAFEHHLKVQ